MACCADGRRHSFEVCMTSSEAGSRNAKHAHHGAAIHALATGLVQASAPGENFYNQEVAGMPAIVVGAPETSQVTVAA